MAVSCTEGRLRGEFSKFFKIDLEFLNHEAPRHYRVFVGVLRAGVLLRDTERCR